MLTATVALYVVGAAFTVYGVHARIRDARLVTIRGLVLDAKGIPVPNAVVRLAPAGAVTVSDDRGAFAFEKVRRSDGLLVTAEWGLMRARPVRVRDARVVKLRLPSEEPPFRVTYLSLQGPAFDLFLSGSYDWSDVLGRSPFVVKNEVLATAGQLAKRFSVPHPGGDLPVWTFDASDELDTCGARSRGASSPSASRRRSCARERT